MSLGGLIGSALAGGVAGYGASKVDELKKEAEQLRQESMLRMQQQFSRENMLLSDSMQNQRDMRNRGWAVDDQAKAQEEQRIKDAQAATARQEDRADAWDRAKWQADRADIAANRADARADARLDAESNKPGEMGKMYKDLSSIYGEEKAREILQSTIDSKKKGQLTPSEMADLKQKAYNQAIKLVIGDSPLTQPTGEEIKKINSESERLYNSYIGGNMELGASQQNVQIPDMAKRELAQKLANAPDDKRQEYAKQLESKIGSENAKAVASLAEEFASKKKSSDPMWKEENGRMVATNPAYIEEQDKKEYQSLISEALDKNKKKKEAEEKEKARQEKERERKEKAEKIKQERLARQEARKNQNNQ